ncbi:hypothetical protein AO930_20045 [Pseudomonas aeruginosa]|uniref:hypothetical protein n=1 Tax=Pseudomonas aeruginosa TaxID=287 RepID=UPI00071B0E7D|nr:hypothetical protein [Pseudomonas aeruginosa]KSF01273.1 hypothetical protein AO930_20045 [Pseudomonas aeruginosa]
MAQFNVDAHLSDGKSLQWLALPDAGEQPLDVADGLRAQVRELCSSLDGAIETAEFLETQKAAESELYARFAE